MMMQGAGNSGSGQVCVPPGFRFHPTDEELLYYYLRKKVCYEAIDLDVIREVDLNKLEPWDLKEKCRIGTGPQNEWYFFSHKDKKYPTGSRTNRATAAGFWKATGRDKPIYHLSNSSSSSMSRRIGMRKTLVFYTGRAPHGQKTDWIMHEYRLIIDHNINNTTPNTTNHHALLDQEDGWVVCRVFKKKNHGKCLQPEMSHDDECLAVHVNVKKAMSCTSSELLQQQQHDLQEEAPGANNNNNNNNSSSSSFGYHQLWDIGSNNYMHLPQLLSSEPSSSSHHHQHVVVTSPFLSPAPLMMMSNMETAAAGGLQTFLRPLTYSQDHHLHNKLNNSNNNIPPGAGDWAFLGKLLASNHQTTDDDVSLAAGDQTTKYCNLLLSQSAANINMPPQLSSSTSTHQHCFPFQHNAFDP